MWHKRSRCAFSASRTLSWHRRSACLHASRSFLWTEKCSEMISSASSALAKPRSASCNRASSAAAAPRRASQAARRASRAAMVSSPRPPRPCDRSLSTTASSAGSGSSPKDSQIARMCSAEPWAAIRRLRSASQKPSRSSNPAFSASVTPKPPSDIRILASSLPGEGVKEISSKMSLKASATRPASANRSSRSADKPSTCAWSLATLMAEGESTSGRPSSSSSLRRSARNACACICFAAISAISRSSATARRRRGSDKAWAKSCVNSPPNSRFAPSTQA
mmetsp:Transcript_8599/g.24023  ORF Transcript_8599/g.24023 Transcript_8599/m.24023 type:complete len:279 (+) Transcript_8599:721-1557(+)